MGWIRATRRERAFWILMMGLLWAAPASADVIPAATCGRTDVANAITAAETGDTVTIPAGALGMCDWPSAIGLNKAITIQCAGRTQTFIRGSAVGGNLTSLIFSWSTPSTGSVRLTGCNLSATGALRCTHTLVNVTGNNGNIRIDNNQFVSNLTKGLYRAGYTRGVIDHNIFNHDQPGGCYTMVSKNDHWNGNDRFNCSGSGCGDRSWSHPIVRGEMFHVEDNVFIKSFNNFIASHDGDFGMRGVYRHNLYTETRWGDHGTETDGRARGDRYSEHYRNIFNLSFSWASNTNSVISVRSGSHRIFDNVINISGGITPPKRLFDMVTYRNDDGFGNWRTWRPWNRCGAKAVTLSRSETTVTGTTSSGAASHGVCGPTPTQNGIVRITGAGAPFDGVFMASSAVSCGSGVGGNLTFTYTTKKTGSASSSGMLTSVHDGNTDSTGYRCLDQVGAGQTVLFDSFFPLVTGQSALEPVWIWNNKKDTDGPSGTTYVLSAGEVNSSGQIASVIVANRDYFNQNTGFDGTSGIGRGLRSARPATCTYNETNGVGVAYWSTDGGSNWNRESSADHEFHDPNSLTHTIGEDGGLDYCSADNTWTNDWYRPSDYPHALVVSGGGTVNQAP